MLLKVTYAQKSGRPEFSSESAGVELTLEVSEKTVSESPASLVDEIRRGFELCRAEVLHQLHQVEPAPAAPARAGLPSQGRAPSTPTPERQPPAGQYNPTHGPDGAARFKTDGFPRSGRELVPWAKKREESGQCQNLWKRLIGFGVASNYPSRVVEWSREEVSAAVHAVLGGDDQYDPEPAPATNGFHNGNGRSY
jgi:hypothetical protein